MATTVLTQHPIGAPFSGTIHNNNLQLIENSFADLGPYVISGLTFSAGTGLSVSVIAGTASIGGRVTVASTFVIAGLVDATTNHIYLLNTGAGTSNTTGTAPANSVKLGTAVTAGGIVTVVAMGRTSGRQQFQQPQNLVLGGPSAGTASAGHPRAANLASWNATQAEGFELFGTLPAGALPSAFTAPATFTVTDAGTTNEPTIMTWQHRTSGTPAASFGNTVLFRADNASNSLADQLSVATGWSTATAGSESSLAIFSIRRAGANTEVMRLNATGNGRLQLAQDFAHVNAAGAVGFFNATPITQPINTTDLRTAIINLGFLASGGATPLHLNGGLLTAGQITCPDSGSFSEHFGASSQATGTDGTAVGFDARATGSDSTAVGTGSRATNGTATAVGVGAQATGTASVAIGGSSIASGPDALAFGRSASATGDDSVAIGISASAGHNKSFAIGAQATSTAANQMIIGSSFSPISTIYAGNGVTNASPAGFIFNATGGSGANVAGANHTVAGGQGTGSAVGGDFIVQSSLAGGAGSTLNALHELARVSSVGVLILTQLTSVQDRTAFDLTPSWATATDATRKARAVFNVWDTAAREAIRIEASGTAAMIGFLGAAAVVRQTAAAAATDLATVITLANSLRTGLIANGLFA